MKYSNMFKFAPCIPALIYCGYFVFGTSLPLFTMMCYTDVYMMLLYCFKLLVFNNSALKEVHIINKCSNIYSESYVTRCIYYGLTHIAYRVVCSLINVTDIYVLKYSVLITLLPKLLNMILKSNAMKEIILIKQNIIKIVIAKLLSLIIKHGSSIYLGMQVDIKVNELKFVIEKYENTKKIMIQMLINIAILLVLSLIKFFSPNNYYYKIATLLYNYNLNDNLESIVIKKNDTNQIQMYRNQLIDLVKKKEWEKLISANNLKIIYQLYINRDNTTNDFEKFVQNILISNFWVSVIWSLSGWVLSGSNSLLIVPLISFYVLVMRESTINVVKLLTILVGGTIGYFTNSLFLTCFLCEFSYLLLINRIILNILKFIVERTVEYTKKIYFKNYKYVIYSCTTLALYINPSFTNIALNILQAICIDYDIKILFIQLAHLIFGAISDYNMFHMLNIAIITFSITPFIDVGRLEKLFIEELPNMFLIIKDNIHLPIKTKPEFIIDDNIFKNADFVNILTSSKSKPIIIEEYARDPVSYKDCFDENCPPLNKSMKSLDDDAPPFGSDIIYL